MIGLLTKKTQCSVRYLSLLKQLPCSTNLAKRLQVQNSSKSRCMSSDTQDFPKSADVVVAGAGAIGSSIAYHLAKLGNKNVLVLEQGRLGCGTSWHSVGLVAQFRGNSLQCNICNYATELYPNLEKDTGYDTGYKNCGAVMVARTKDREILFRRLLDKARQYNVPCEIISPKEAQDLYPLLRIDDIRMAVWSPNDGVVNASDICQSLMKGATQNGVRFVEGVGVKNVATDGKRVVGVDTDHGFVHCEKFINSSGLWARDLGLRCDTPVNLPVHPCEHFYIVTKPMDGVHPMLPTLRDHDGYFYAREWSGGIMIGGFEPVAKPCFYENGTPEKFEFQLLQEDWEHFEILMNGMTHRIPALEKAEIRQFVNGPESFTPDGKFLFGETPEVENYFVAAAMNSNGIMTAGGMGKLTAELVTHGTCSWDTSMIDIKRFPSELNNKLFLRDRVKEVLGRHYTIDYPKASPERARKFICSPIFDVFDNSGAQWGENMGWEVANYFSEDGKDFPLTFGKPGWLGCVEKEYKACKEGVALADLSSQSKFEITSNTPDRSLESLQKIFAKDVDLEIGQFVKTALLTKDGKYKGVATVCRVSDKRWLILTTRAQHNHLLPHLKKHLESATIQDVTTKYSSIGILGPSAASVLGQLTRTSLEEGDFAVGQCKTVDLGYATNVILSRGYLNSENYWEALVPTEFARGLFQLIKDGSRDFNFRLVGQFALETLRLDAGIPEYGVDLGPTSFPAQFGNASFVDAEKAAPFIGKEVVSQCSSNKFSFMKLAIDNVQDENWLWGGEPVYVDDVLAGNLTTASYCFDRMQPVAFGVLDEGLVSGSNSIVVKIAGAHHAATILPIN